MAFEEGGERIDDMKAVLGRTADAATLFDTDGIVVRCDPPPLPPFHPWSTSKDPFPTVESGCREKELLFLAEFRLNGGVPRIQTS